MPRYFMRDTPLASLEREMMIPPRYGPRTSQPALPPARITVEMEQRVNKGAMVLAAQYVTETEDDI